MSDYPMLISNKLHSFRNFNKQKNRNSSYRKTSSQSTKRERERIYQSEILANQRSFLGNLTLLCSPKPSRMGYQKLAPDLVCRKP